jgi:acyl transferase domain-containing protein
VTAKLNVQLRHNPVAIIGMGGIFPQARNLREFWSNIVGKVDCITDVPESHWRIEDYYDPDPAAPDKTYCKRGGFLPEVDFDPMEFGLPPNILEVTDVSQMLSLLVAKEALADAGYLNTTADIRDRTGIVLGVGGGQKLIVPLSSRLQYPVWREALLSSGLSETDADKIIEKIKLAYIRWEENSFPGMLGNVIAGRIANRFDLGGINCVTDAACASSMSALRLAISELTEGRADMMITGGVDTDNSIVMYMNFSKTPAFTKGDVPRPFDAQSDGMMVGEGIGMMILKRLEDAERDGDKIYAVIKGVGASSDGRFKSIYAPRGEGQEKALKRAYEDAGFSASTVGLFEAHGTGTVAGDTTEVTTAVRYLNSVDNQKQHIALGSVKSQIGHAKAAAGIAGLIKAALALHHKVLPATLNVDQPNPKFDLETSPLYVNTETRPWIREGETPRRAGISSFGFGGTNFHVVMEEYSDEHKGAYRLQQTAQALIFTALTPSELATKVNEALSLLQSGEAYHHFLNFVKQTRESSIPANHARVGFVALDAAEAVTILQAAADLLRTKAEAEEWQHPKGVYYRRSSLNLAGRVVALFAGQGSQYLDMGRELALNFPEMREAFRQIDTLLEQDGKQTLSRTVYPRPAFNEAEKQIQEAALQSTDYAQPAIGAMSAAMFRILQNAGFRPDFTAGHSFGEVSALWAAGAISDMDYYRLIKARGAAMAARPAANFDAGTMLAVTGDVAAIEAEVLGLPGVQVANRNSRTQVVLAGAKDAIKTAETSLKAKGYRVVPLSVSAAFHTPLVGHAQKPFADVINSVSFNSPQRPVYSNATGQPYPADPSAMKQMLSEHMLQSVLFRDEIENIYAAGGSVFVEFGPRNVLTNLVKDILADKPHVAIALNGSRQKDSDRQLREGVVQLQVMGLSLNTLDPYHLEPDNTPKKKGMLVKLSGANYVSQKTRDTYQDALENGYKVTAVIPQIPQPGTPTPAPQPDPLPQREPAPVPQPMPLPEPQPNPLPEPDIEPLPSPDPEPVEPADMMTHLENLLSLIREHQIETQRIQSQFQQNQSEYFRIFFDLTQQQQTLMASVSSEVMSAITQSMMRFHDHQAETLRLHEREMQDRSQTMQTLLELMRQQYGALSTTPAAAKPQTVSRPVQQAAPTQKTVAQIAQPILTPAPAAAPVAPPPVASVPSVDVSALSAAMLRIVGDKTGYPAEMLDLSMDMEADLGIDSIKRVEILGAMRDEFPALPQFSPEELAELRTLGQIVDYMRQSVNGSHPAPPTMPAPAAPAVPVVEPVVAPQPVATNLATTVAPIQSNNGVDVSALSAAMLRIVGDKTGYPADMLELSMDMEADLGIDSIKRVEILGAMRDEFPALPQFSPEELAELRTLGQIVDYMRQSVNGSHPAPPTTPAPAAPQPVATNLATTVAPIQSNNGVDVSALSAAMLRIVGDKTGYPADMLELSMDMEADLGIDSIKRVEILGAMRDEFPALPQFSPEELAELRTLGQIVDYMRQSVNGSHPAPPTTPAPAAPQPAVASAAAPTAPTQTNNGVDVSALSAAMLRIVGDKTGYPADMLELSMDMEADLGIDSIKRVEILGAMRDEFPALPQFSPEELAELRTLGEIVQYMQSSVSIGAPVEDAVMMDMTHNQVNEVLPVQPMPTYDTQGIQRSVVEVIPLPAPDYLEFAIAPGSVCLITDDGSPATGELAGNMTVEGWRVVVLNFPASIMTAQSALPSGVSRVTLPDLSEAALQNTLKSIGNVGMFIHLSPSSGLSNGTMFLENEKALVKHVFLIAKHLKAILNSNTSGRKGFITVTRLDGALGTAGMNGYGTIAGGLFGLIKTLNLEWNSVFCRAIDFAPDMNPQQIANTVVAEIHDPNRMITEVAYGTQGRVTLVAHQLSANGVR